MVGQPRRKAGQIGWVGDRPGTWQEVEISSCGPELREVVGAIVSRVGRLRGHVLELSWRVRELFWPSAAFFAPAATRVAC